MGGVSFLLGWSGWQWAEWAFCWVVSLARLGWPHWCLLQSHSWYTYHHLDLSQFLDVQSL